MSIDRTENFLGAFEKKVAAQKVRFCQNIPASFQLHFLKISTFLLFLTCNLIGALYGHDFFTDAEN